MSGIKGQPGTKPSNVNSPVPAVGASASAFDNYEPPAQSAFDTYSPAGAEADTSPGMGAVIAQKTADWAPTIVGLGGSVVGSALGPAGAIAGAALGGAAGQGYREFIETNILGKPAKDPNEALADVGKSAALEGAGQAVGMGVAKVAGKVMGTAAGQAISDTVSKVASPVTNFVKDSVQAVRDKIQEPLTQLIANKVTPMSTEAAGDAAKSLLKQNIQGKYGPFIQAYANLDQVSKALPIADKANLRFFDSTMDWARNELGGDQYRVVKKFSQDLVDSGNGAKFDSVLSDIGDAIRAARKNGLSDQATVLRSLRDKASDFIEGETTKLAARIKGGAASLQEMQFLDQLAAQRGVDSSQFFQRNKGKYAEKLADDFLSAKDKIKNDYAGFRQFLSDVGEQTKTKAEKFGPMTFLNNLDEVPSEKLIERMFDPKNAAALRAMQKETPEVFDTVVKSKMSQIVQKSSPTGELDLAAFRKNMLAMPDSTRTMLMSSDEMKLMHSVVDNPRLARLQNVEKLGESSVMRWAAGLAELAHVTGDRAISGAQAALSSQGPGAAAAARQVVGQSVVNPLSAAFGPQQ